MEFKNLTPFQLDALKEVFNIGSGNVATSLSILIGQKVDMAVPNINIVEIEELYTKYKDDEVIAVLVKVLGEVTGNVLYVFEKENAMDIISKLTNNNSEELDAIGESVIGEIGNIISSSFINSIATFVNLEATVSVPAVVNDMLSAIVVSCFLDSGQHEDHILDIETLFLDQEENEVAGHFYFIPSPGSLNKILNNLGIR